MYSLLFMPLNIWRAPHWSSKAWRRSLSWTNSVIKSCCFLVLPSCAPSYFMCAHYIFVLSCNFYMWFLPYIYKQKILGSILQSLLPIFRIAVASSVNWVASHPFVMVSQSFDICRRLNSMLSNLDVGLATIAQHEEYFVLSHVLHSVYLQPPHVLPWGSILVQILVHIFAISHCFPFGRGAPWWQKSLLHVPPIPFSLGLNIPSAQSLWLKNGLCLWSGHPQCTLQRVVNQVGLLPNFLAPLLSQCMISDLVLHLGVLALRWPRSHILEIVTTIGICAPQHRFVYLVFQHRMIGIHLKIPAK